MAQGFGSRLGNLFGCTTVPVDIEVAGVGTGWLLDFLLVLEKCGYPGQRGWASVSIHLVHGFFGQELHPASFRSIG